jgi:predicted acylesterase/phospholipase RssA
MSEENLENLAEVQETEEIQESSKSKIKHLVISGGGTAGFVFYGVLLESHNQGFWNINDIETIYSTSAGSINAVLIALKYDWDTLSDYIIKRPWQNVFNLNISRIMSSFQERGILDRKCIEQIFAPLFAAKDISMNITMAEFYEKTGIDIHMFTTSINKLELVDISHKTHPDWKVMDAVYCSSALPIIFKPLLVENHCYCDGAFINNYPLVNCIDSGACPDEIFGVCKYTMSNSNEKDITEESSIFDYLFSIISKIFLRHLKPTFVPIANELILDLPPTNINEFFNTAHSCEERTRLIDSGRNLFLEKFVSSANKE